MKLSQCSIFLLLTAFISSCTGEHDEDISNVIQHKNSEKTIAISGIITSEYSKQTIVVSRSIDFSELYLSSDGDPNKFKDASSNKRVSGAKVSVEVAGKKYEFKEIHDSINYYGMAYVEIYYESVDSFAGIPNQEHKLVVEVEGKTYTATDVMPQVSEITFNENSPLYLYLWEGRGSGDTATCYPEYLFGQQEAFIMGFVPIPTPEAKQLFGWQDHFNYNELIPNFGQPCYSFRQLASPQLIGAVSENSFITRINPGNIENMDLTDTVVVSKMSCSPPYEYFLYCLFQNLKASQYDFGEISSNLPTNISNGGVGFFSACDVKRKDCNKWELTRLAHSIGKIVEH
ncbi:MAG: DUF4249 family protein [Bacteroidales bacterium]|nr:DUF4249 family protein [Bacteroidales bacterium]